MDKSTKFLIHDLRNKLQVLSSKIEMAQSKLLKEGVNPTLVQEVFIGLDRTMSEVSEICRSGNAENDTAVNFKISQLILKNIEDYSLNNALKIIFTKKSDPILHANNHLFSRLIENLLKNSIEAGSTKVDIELSSTRLILIDNGGGISPNHLEDINSGNFYSTKRSDRGLGLEFIHDFCKENGCEVFIRRNSDDLRSIGVSVELDFESLLKAAGEFAV